MMLDNGTKRLTGYTGYTGYTDLRKLEYKRLFLPENYPDHPVHPVNIQE